MVTLRAIWAIPGLLLLSLSAGAQGVDRECPADLPRPRNLYVTKDAESSVPEIRVAGGVATTLRFEKECDPARTKLLGWEGRFEPMLVGGRSVVIVPLRGLADGEHFLLQVTLADGTSIPFTVTSTEDFVDGQVNVYPEPESHEAVRTALAEQRKKNEALVAENQRQREEQTSVDHALAALLANGQLRMTPFREHETWKLNDEGLVVEVSVLGPKAKEPMQKAAVVFKVTNKSATEPWALQEARLMTATSSKHPPFALRMTPATIAPGATGRVAIVTDLAEFVPDAKDPRLVLELFRTGGLRQVYVAFTPSSWR